MSCLLLAPAIQCGRRRRGGLASGGQDHCNHPAADPLTASTSCNRALSRPLHWQHPTRTAIMETSPSPVSRRRLLATGTGALAGVASASLAAAAQSTSPAASEARGPGEQLQG